MTAEVAILNRSAVALAADSAATVESLFRNRLTTKVFNTANKLFTLSKFAPVGVMFYNTMTLGGVPLETIIKQYRRDLRTRKFDTLEQYCDHFFEYLTDNNRLFSIDDQKEVALILMLREFTRIIHGKESESEVQEALERKKADLVGRDKVRHFEDTFCDELKNKFGKPIEDALTISAENDKLSKATLDLARDVGALLLTRKEHLSGYTGVVFAGFGEEQIYPSMREYVIDAVVDNKIKYNFNEHWLVSYAQQSHVVPFAERETVRTILEGVSLTYGRRFYEEALKMLGGLAEVIVSNIAELDQDKKDVYVKSASDAAIGAFRTLVGEMNRFREAETTRPIYKTISLMPISELSVAAEVFVNLAQMRQKMLLETETVGGPIDVAVISKGDGFVWIKRKHYFEKEINPFFLEKYLSEHI